MPASQGVSQPLSSSTKWQLAAVLTMAVLSTSFHVMQAHGSQSAALLGGGSRIEAEAEATQLGQARVPYDLIIGMTHHKTGTTQMGCLLYHFAYALNLSTPAYQDNFVLPSDVAMHLVQRRQEKPPLAFLTGHELMKQCYYQNVTKHWVICPNQFPCSHGRRPVLALANCHLALPTANVALLHFIRDPLDVVLSAYKYHMQDPPPEKWIETMKVAAYLPFLERRGVPLHRLESLGMSPTAPASLSYGQLLRGLPPERGVQLEFWRTVPMMYAMAQQFVMLQQHPSAMQVRFEDLRFRFNATVRAIAEGLYVPYSAEVLLAAAHAAKCDPATWDATQRAQHTHVTWGKGDGAALATQRRALLRDKSIRRHLCLLQRTLGYAQETECDEGLGAFATRKLVLL